MSRATNHLLESLTTNDRSVVDSLPTAGKLLLLQWVTNAIAIDISDLGSRLAPLPQTSSGGDYLYEPPAKLGEAPSRGMGDRFRRGLNIPPAVEESP